MALRIASNRLNSPSAVSDLHLLKVADHLQVALGAVARAVGAIQ
jgi:hypothetical protein